jgi:hypothetical protein
MPSADPSTGFAVGSPSARFDDLAAAQSAQAGIAATGLRAASGNAGTRSSNRARSPAASLRRLGSADARCLAAAAAGVSVSSRCDDVGTVPGTLAGVGATPGLPTTGRAVAVLVFTGAVLVAIGALAVRRRAHSGA